MSCLCLAGRMATARCNRLTAMQGDMHTLARRTHLSHQLLALITSSDGAAHQQLDSAAAAPRNARGLDAEQMACDRFVF
jgi:hypothetical protein